MSDYLVSARKYRPNTFSDVVGQEHITKTLDNAITNNQVAHAYLFCGPRGVGKTSCARIFAELVNKDTESNSIYNIFELDGASNNQVNDIRILIDQVKIPPQTGKYKIYIIDEVHMLTSSAFNAFLKTLEEPPKHSIFILATTEKNKVIPTILSRCQIFDFKKISSQNIASHLENLAIKENIISDKRNFRLIAEQSDGSLRDSLSMFDRVHSFCNKDWDYESVSQILLCIDVRVALQMTEHFINQNIANSILLVNNLLDKGFNAKDILNVLISHFRNLMMAKSTDTISLIREDEHIRTTIVEQSKAYSSEQILKALNCLNDCSSNYKNAINQHFLVELCVMQLCSLQKKEHEEEKKKITIFKATDTSNTKLDKKEESINLTKQSKEDNQQIKTHKSTPSASNSIKEKHQKNTKKGLSNSIFNIAHETEKNHNRKNFEIDKKDSQNILTKENAHFAWKEFSNMQKELSKTNLHNILERYVPEIDENNLTVTVVNMAEQAEIKENKNKLLNFLQQKIGNKNISIDIIISESEERNMLYTTDEKLKHLVNKNENIKILKERLDLNII